METRVICAKGATTDKIISLFKNYPHKLKFCYIIAQSGINDLIEGLSEEETARAQNRLIKSIRSTFPSANVLFIPLHPFILDGELMKLSSLKNDLLSCMWNNFNKSFLVKDGVHLSAIGHTFLAECLAQKITKKNFDSTTSIIIKSRVRFYILQRLEKL